MSGINRATLHFEERSPKDGSKFPALVFLHYFGGSGRTWRPVMQLMARRGYHCIAPDLRGFGKSASSSTDPNCYTVQRMSEDVHELVAQLSLRTFVAIGHSMGGKVALALAARQPLGLLRVVLLAPSPPSPEPMPPGERAHLLASYGNAAALEEILRKTTARPLPKRLFDFALADNLHASAAAWRAWLEDGSREDICSQMQSVRVPVAVAIGAEDTNITADLVRREIAARLDTFSGLETIAESGHLLPLEAPEETSVFLGRELGVQAQG